MAGGQEEYYLGLATEDYYTKGGEPPGRWWGRGARAFELRGTVDPTQLRNLFRGYSTDGERSLVRNAGSHERRAGFDLTFSAEKTVSTAWAAADENARRIIQDCHDTAVVKAMGYVEDLCGWTRTGAQGQGRERIGLAAAIFQHGTARAAGSTVPDPQLHSHCLVLNLCKTPDGRTRSIDSSELFRRNLKMSAGALYRAELFAQLEKRLGLLATKREGETARLDVVPDSLREEFSKRRAAILSLLEERGATGARSSADAALVTRERKQDIDRAKLFAKWQETCADHGLTPEKLRAFFQAPPPRESSTLVAVAMERAKARATEQESHFSVRELTRFVAEEVEALGVGADAVREAVGAELETSLDVAYVGELAGDRRYTTREMLELELSLLKNAQEMAGQAHTVPDEVLGDTLSKHSDLLQEQSEAVRALTQGGRIGLLRGMAGTGKTFTLRTAREVWEASGFEVRGAALASVAAIGLEEGSGIKSENIHRTLWAIEHGKLTLTSKSILVVDEAGMVGTRQLEALMRAAYETGAKLVLTGDDRQLQAIRAGAPFKNLVQLLGCAELTHIFRQEEGWARDAVREFAAGEASSALERFKERGLFHVERDKTAVLRQLVSDWKELSAAGPLRDTMILAGTRLQALETNRHVQALRVLDEDLGQESLRCGNYDFHQGDRVLFRRNSALVKNGERGEVTKVDVENNLLTVKLDRGTRVTIDLDSYSDVHLGYAGTTHSLQGQTLTNCLVIVGGSMQDREATYVQASRARTATHLYVDALTAGPELSDLVRSMSRSRQKDLAVEVAANADLDLVPG